MIAFPQRLPMLRAGIQPPGQYEDGGFHGRRKIVMQCRLGLRLGGPLDRCRLALQSADEIRDGKRLTPRVAFDGLDDRAANDHTISKVRSSRELFRVRDAESD